MLHLVCTCAMFIYYINTNEIPGELSRGNLKSSHVKISLLLWLHNKSRLSHQKTGNSLVFKKIFVSPRGHVTSSMGVFLSANPKTNF